MKYEVGRSILIFKYILPATFPQASFIYSLGVLVLFQTDFISSVDLQRSYYINKTHFGFYWGGAGINTNFLNNNEHISLLLRQRDTLPSDVPDGLFYIPVLRLKR